jgi:ATP-binding cassette subfamily B (MDR/TAP) protein 1
MFISAVAIAFSRGWLMTLVTIATVPAIVFGAYLYSIAAAKEESELVNDYAEAGGKAEEAISSIKTVKQLNGEKFEADNYADRLINVTKNSTKYGMLVGIGLGSLIAMILFSYSLGFWFGSNCVEGSSKCPPSMNGGKAYSAGDVMVIFFGIF